MRSRSVLRGLVTTVVVIGCLAAVAGPATAQPISQVKLMAAGCTSDGALHRLQNYNSNKLAEVYLSSIADGATVDQWTNNGTDTQKWVVWHCGYTSDGFAILRFQNDVSERFMEVYHSSTANGAAVDQWVDNGSDTQYWVDKGSASTHILFNYHSGKVLEVYHSSLADGAIVDQYDFNGSNTQFWYIV